MQPDRTPVPATDALTTATRWPGGLTPGSPAAAGLDSGRLEAAFAVLSDAIAGGRIPGAVAAVVRGGVVAACRALGWAQANPERRPMQPDTLFDVASLTKVMATLPAILLLLERGVFRLDDRVQLFFPEFTGGGREEVRIRHLLTHTSGLPDFIPFDLEPGSRDDHIRRVLGVALLEQPGNKVIYSDLGFILLGELVQKVTGMPLDRCAREWLFDPLGLTAARFNPPGDLQPLCAATEFREALGRPQCGEVHDERATALGGVAGHAGLFATALDVAAYGHLWCNGGAVEGLQLLSPTTVSAATRNHTPGLNDSRGLGWLMSLEHSEFMSCGDLFSPGSFGHTGFTGTSLWVDPPRRLAVALLTNRVHLGRDNDAMIRLRPRFHNAVAASVL